MKTDWWRDTGAMMIASVGLQYAGAMAVFFWNRQPWMAVTYLGYAIGNVGLIMIALGYK